MSQAVDRAEANRLYWETDESVADIARRLDVSRRALYEAIEPLPTGAACDVCGSALLWENRSARLADDATCPHCASAGATDADLPPQPDFDADDERLTVLGAAALAGAVIAAAVTFAVVPRR
jgi:hypothetical protein